MTTTMTRTPRPLRGPVRGLRGPRRWWRELDDSTRKRIVDGTAHATMALFAVGSFVLCVIALQTI